MATYFFVTEVLVHPVYIYIYIYNHENVLPKDRSFTTNSGTKAVGLSKGMSSTAKLREPRLQFHWGWIGAVASHCFPHPPLSL